MSSSCYIKEPGILTLRSWLFWDIHMSSSQWASIPSKVVLAHSLSVWDKRKYIKLSCLFHPLLIASSNFFFLIDFFNFWLSWVFIAAYRLSLVAASRGYSSCGVWAPHCGGFSCCRAWTLGSMGSVAAAQGLQSLSSGAVAHGLTYPKAHRIFLDQGSNPCLLH